MFEKLLFLFEKHKINYDFKTTIQPIPMIVVSAVNKINQGGINMYNWVTKAIIDIRKQIRQKELQITCTEKKIAIFTNQPGSIYQKSRNVHQQVIKNY